MVAWAVFCLTFEPVKEPNRGFIDRSWRTFLLRGSQAFDLRVKSLWFLHPTNSQYILNCLHHCLSGQDFVICFAFTRYACLTGSLTLISFCSEKICRNSIFFNFCPIVATYLYDERDSWTMRSFCLVLGWGWNSVDRLRNKCVFIRCKNDLELYWSVI